MTRPNEEQVRAALGGVVDPESGRDIVAGGLVQGLVVRDGHVAFTLDVAAERGPRAEPLRRAAVAAVERLPGILSVSAVLTAERAKPPAPPARGPGQASGPGRGPGHAPGPGRGPGHAPGLGPAQPRERLLPSVTSIVAVASGKGGVGKSTTATNLAVALAAAGHKVGLLDADIYGPSVPRMMGMVGKPRSLDGKTMEPFEVFGVKCMSIGVLVPEDTAMIWRGPMVMSALQQLMRDVNWGALDIMIVDMPPGTGDAQLTMAQQVPLAGAVIVSTPQDIALLDARKGFAMFQKVEVPILGFVETMSYFACPHCGERTDIFGHGGAAREAERLGVEFLGEIPLDIAVRMASDGGRPIVAASPESIAAQAYRRIAERIAGKLGEAGRTAPRITVT